VYAVWFDVGGKTYPGVANIGVRPTFDGLNRTVEVHLFDFNQDIYQQAVTVHLVEFIRPEQKFAGLEALVAQIKADVATTGRLLAEKQPPAWAITWPLNEA
jgi:riboflavin kinase/FMN adenylyltransferase